MEEEDEYEPLPNELETEIRILRLITGEDLITECAELSEEEGFGIIVINPLKIVYFFNQSTGNMTINFIRWFNSILVEDQVFRIEQENVLTYQYPSKKLASKYNSWISSDEEEMNVFKRGSPKGKPVDSTRKSVEEELKHLEELDQKLSNINVTDFVSKALVKAGKKSRPKKPKGSVGA